jgi:hypothetical protein
MTGSIGGRVQHSRAAPIAIPPPLKTPATDPGPAYCPNQVWDNARTGGSPFTLPVAAAYASGNNDLYTLFAGTDFGFYSVSGDNWTNVSPAPFTSAGRGGALPNGLTKVLFFTSNGAGSATTRNYKFSGSPAWEGALAPMPTPRINFAMANSNIVHFIGGATSGGVASTAHETYSTGLNSWGTKAALPVALKNASGDLGPNLDIYVWGVDAGGAQHVYRWDNAGDFWTALGNPPWGGGGQNDLIVTPFVVQSHIVFLVGGGDGSAFLSTEYWTYDPASDTYVPMPDADTAGLVIPANGPLSSQATILSTAADLRVFGC